ncbi:MAG TPA: peptidoglycan editing factor PgeF [Thermoanaerobaculia bacterium]|nr:peptidoglycan editing factor PgeF [Thermoanaerobaculia bacterium]
MTAGVVLFPGVPSGFAAGFTTLEGVAGDSPALGRRLAAAFGVPDAEVARLAQVHGRNVLAAEGDPEPGRDRVVGEGDALVTRDPSRILAVASADCTPVLLLDAESGWIAAVHAGWRGTAARVVSAAIESFRERGVAAKDLLAFFGPSISRESYEVGPEVIAALRSAHAGDPVSEDAVRPGAGDRSFVDVAAFNRAELLAAGVREDNVVDSGFCTASRKDLFPSYRRDGAGTGRVLTGVVRLPR